MTNKGERMQSLVDLSRKQQTLESGDLAEAKQMVSKRTRDDRIELFEEIENDT